MKRPSRKGEHTYNMWGDKYLVTTLVHVRVVAVFLFVVVVVFWGGRGVWRSASWLTWRVAWKTVQVQILLVIKVVVEPGGI